MSTRAYKIIKIEREADPTFNLSHDEIIRELIPSVQEQYENNNDIITIQKEEIIQACQDFIKNDYTVIISDDDKSYYIDLLAKMRKDADIDGHVEYYCY